MGDEEARVRSLNAICEDGGVYKEQIFKIITPTGLLFLYKRPSNHKPLPKLRHMFITILIPFSER